MDIVLHSLLHILSGVSFSRSVGRVGRSVGRVGRSVGRSICWCMYLLSNMFRLALPPFRLIHIDHIDHWLLEVLTACCLFSF